MIELAIWMCLWNVLWKINDDWKGTLFKRPIKLQQWSSAESPEVWGPFLIHRVPAVSLLFKNLFSESLLTLLFRSSLNELINKTTWSSVDWADSQASMGCFSLLCRYHCLAIVMADFSRQVFQNQTLPAGQRSLSVQLFLKWCAQTEWLYTMGSMQWSAGYNEADVWLLGPHSRWGGDRSLLLSVGFTPLCLFSLVCLSWPLALSSPLANMWTRTRKNTLTPTHPPPLVLIIPLQIRRSISSCIIVSPTHPPLPSSSPFKSGGEKLPFEPLSVSLAGVSRFSHSLLANQKSALRQGPIRWQLPAQGKDEGGKKANRCD